MTLKGQFETVTLWLDCVSSAILAALGRYISARSVKLVEQEDNSFAIEPQIGNISGHVRIADGKLVGPIPEDVAAHLRGSRLTLVLRPQPFLFRPIELPKRADEFLAGVVRAQIDRLTPWSADDAAFGWSTPTAISGDRIVVTIAATARAKILPYLQALDELSAQSIAVLAAPQVTDTGLVPIKVLGYERRSVLDVRRIHRVLASVLLGAVILAGAAGAANFVLTGYLDTRRDELARKITERRAVIRASGELGADTGVGAERLLERRKYASPSTVLVLEALSQILPDHTYVTELRIEGDKLRVIGVTQDAPSLISLIEQLPQFTRATFFAPTTRSPSDPGERFHIEAHIEPLFSPRS
jgi:general secretion pathway protein L